MSDLIMEILSGNLLGYMLCLMALKCPFIPASAIQTVRHLAALDFLF